MTSENGDQCLFSLGFYIPPPISLRSFLIIASQSPLQALFFSGFHSYAFAYSGDTINVCWMTLPLKDQFQVYQETDSWVLGTKGVPEFRKQKPILNTVPSFRICFLHNGSLFIGEFLYCWSVHHCSAVATPGEQIIYIGCVIWACLIQKILSNKIMKLPRLLIWEEWKVPFFFKSRLSYKLISDELNK